MGLVISFTADADEDASIGASHAPLSSRAPETPTRLIPARRDGFAALLAARSAPSGLLHRISLEVGDLSPGLPLDEIQPRIALKHNVHAWPKPDRSQKGDPVVGLRPTFDAKLRQRGGVAAMRAADLLLSSENYLAFDGFAPAIGPAPGPDAVASFEPLTDAEASSESPATEQTASPTQGGSAPTLRAAGRPSPGVFDGATPRIPRAVALGSTTPAAADQTPVEIVAAPPGAPDVVALPGVKPPPNATILDRNGERPDYASLIDQDRAASEEKCLAEAVYFEARSEPADGQAAVAQVVLNRVKSGLYPSTICGVVFQNHRHRNACQFSFACEGRALRVTEPESWKAAVRVAHDVLQGETYVADVGDSTHYHANYVRPRWARYLKKMDTIGHHIFYQLRPGQT